MVSISYQYLLGSTTISNIIFETCTIIWNMLCPVVLPSSLTEEDWLDIAADFENQCNFPHCIGAIDGKHIIIQVCISILLSFIYRHLSLLFNVFGIVIGLYQSALLPSNFS